MSPIERVGREWRQVETFANGRVVCMLGDCLEVMATFASNSIDMVMTDLPYGTTYATWDDVLPMGGSGGLWAEYRWLVRDKGAHVFTSSQPFTTQLVSSWPEGFRCEWIWNKENSANFANANRQPMKVHENVLVFASGQTTYNPQKVSGQKNHAVGNRRASKSGGLFGVVDDGLPDMSGMKYPKSIQTFAKHASQSKLHPTQKPVELFEYFICTYSNEDEVVLDNCAGSGTCGVAALNAGRQAVLIEKDPVYFRVMCERLQGVSTGGVARPVADGGVVA